jgi:hypothetical protein
MHQATQPTRTVVAKSLPLVGLLLIVAAVGLSGCGGVNSAGSATPPAPQSPAPPAASASANVGSTALGAPVMITDPQGYKFEIRASVMHTTPALTSSTGQTSDAPPGQVFLTVDVQVKNPLTDRGEPLTLATHDGSFFFLSLPRTSSSAFGLGGDPGSLCQELTPMPNCEVMAKVSSMSPTDNLVGPVQLAAAGVPGPPEVVQLMFPVPVLESAPVGQLTLSVSFSLQVDATNSTPIPLGR